MLGQLTRHEKLTRGGLYLSIFTYAQNFSAEIINPPGYPEGGQLLAGPHQNYDAIFYMLDVSPSESLARFLKETETMDPDQRAKMLTVVKAILASPGRTKMLAESLNPQEQRLSKERLLYQLHKLAAAPELENPDLIKDALFKKQGQI
mmetsp:Transcript_759/g.943  ORF Transcript_759/g.943 Transcript_759/m.943 type:complete len:148 (-) Transcript_759:364-807(-)